MALGWCDLPDDELSLVAAAPRLVARGTIGRVAVSPYVAQHFTHSSGQEGGWENDLAIGGMGGEWRMVAADSGTALSALGSGLA